MPDAGGVASAKSIPFQPARPDGLPEGFELRADGIYRRLSDGENEARLAFLCSPIRVLALTRDRTSKGWGRLVEIIDPDGRRHVWAIPAELFAADGADLRRECLRLGMHISSERGSRMAFVDLLQRWAPKTRATTAARLGWADKDCSAFVLGDGRCVGGDQVVLQMESAPDLAPAMFEAGTLDGWREHIAAKASGNPVLVLAISLAFAGPLLEPLGLEGGGVHLRGASSAGKSTALRVAASVWGAPGFVGSWRATANGLESVAAVANGTLLALDEMGEVSGRDAGAAAYMLANGRGKSRASRSGAARASACWTVLFLSTGEIGLADKMAEAGERARAGQAVRLIDIAADGRAFGIFDDIHGAAGGARFADDLKRAAAENHGKAGPTFVEMLLQDMERHRAGLRTLIQEIAAVLISKFDLEGDGQSTRVAHRLALIGAAGELATQFGITGWSKGEASEAVMEALRLWLDGRGGSGPSEAREAIRRTRDFICRHGASRFERLGEDGLILGQIVHDRAGWMDKEYFYITPDVWAEDVHAGADPKRAAQYLRDADLLVAEAPTRLKRKAPRSVPSRPRVYWISIKIMGAGDD